jgi:hypothetical protein
MCSGCTLDGGRSFAGIGLLDFKRADWQVVSNGLLRK